MSAVVPPIAGNSYDLLPYHSQAFVQTHPDRLACLAALHGLQAPPVGACRVLELGCASGGNLIPMACALPGSQFVGIDLSARQVEQGRATIARLGLGNVRIEHASITDVDAGWGDFDYLVCHGVFSWVPVEVQDKVLEIAAQRLTTNGVAYVSYNTYPGWHLRGSVRYMLAGGRQAGDDPATAVARARAQLEGFSRALPAAGAHAQLLGDEIKRLQASADWYLFHEFLEADNTPLYFRDFMRRAEDAGLQYLGEADFASMPVQPPAGADRGAQAAQGADTLDLEQQLDFVRNRHFRQTLLCKREHTLSRPVQLQALAGLYAASAARSEAGVATDLRPGVVQHFVLPGSGQAASANPLTKAALVELAQHWPLGMPVEALFAAARERVAPWLAPAAVAASLEVLRQDLLQGYASGLVRLHTWQPDCATAVSAQPQASRWVAGDLLVHPQVTNLRHEVINLRPFTRALLACLDGRHSHEALLDHLDSRVADGTLAPPFDEPADADPLRRRAQVQRWMNDSLERLVSYALLSA